MVKHSVSPRTENVDGKLSRYFMREWFVRSKVLAGLLLLAFLAQAGWLVESQWRSRNHKETVAVEESEGIRIAAGWGQWHGREIAGAPYLGPSVSSASPSSDRPAISDSYNGNEIYDTDHSPLLALVSSAPLLAMPDRWWTAESFSNWGWLTRLPFLACGVFLGASLWYVARRLCGTHGGLVALALYCFSPAMIQASAVWHTEPEIMAAWGAFGAIFTAIAVAHTLYAPREVVLWNWRRILLLGVALAIAIGSQFSMIVLVPLALMLLLYVAPVRRQAGLVIWLAACTAASVLLFAVYFFHAHAFVESLRHAAFWEMNLQPFASRSTYREAAVLLGRACPAFLLALPVALVTYVLWPRTRYFGNTAPLAVALLFIVLGIAHPHAIGETYGAGFLLAAVPFLFLFVAGVLADLMETRYKPLLTAGVVGLVVANSVWSVTALARIAMS